MGLTKSDAAALAIALDKTDQILDDVLLLGVPEIHFSFEWFSLTLLPRLGRSKQFGPNQERYVTECASGTRNLSFKEFFTLLGCRNIHTCDISDYEGAEIIVDLNSETSTDLLTRKYDLIVDAGTLEHCFNLPQALRTLTTSLKDGGIIFHTNPANHMIDHGFFQISPTFYSDYYLASNFELIFGGLALDCSCSIAEVRIKKYTRDVYRLPSRRPIASIHRPQFVVFIARKRPHAQHATTVTQRYYQKMHSQSGNVGPELQFETDIGDIFIRRKIRTSFRAVANFIRTKWFKFNNKSRFES